LPFIDSVTTDPKSMST